MSKRIYEHLQHALDDGIITIEGYDFVGVAQDGREVTIGDTGNPAAANHYLASHSTPDTW